MILIPNRETKTLVQTNRGDLLGNLWATFSIDLQSNPGRIKVGNKLKLNTSTASDSDLGLPVAIKAFDDRVFAICGSKIFNTDTSNLSDTFAEDVSTGAVSTYSSWSDLEIFNGTLVASTASGTDLMSKASNTAGTGDWTDRNGSLTSNTLHKLKYFKKHNKLYVTNNNTEIKSIDTSWNVVGSGNDYAIDIGENSDVGSISTMDVTSDSIWIGTIQFSSDNLNQGMGGKVLQWDGKSSDISKPYSIPGGVLAMTVKDETPYVIDTNGRLYAYVGYGFKEVGRLPIKDNQHLGQYSSSTLTRAIHPNGICITQNGTIEVLVNNRNSYLRDTNNGDSNENLPSGVWEWSEANGFVHKHALSYMPIDSTTVTDYGQNRVNAVGALARIKLLTASATPTTSLICGAQYFTNATTTTYGIFTEAPYPLDNATYPEGQKYGSFVTTWIDAENIVDNWQKLAAKFRQFLDSGDRITLKYRTREASSTEISLTWVNTTSFTTTTDVSGMVGYEVEFLQGTGSGKCVHISSVSEDAGTYTVTIDEVVTGVTTGTAKARLQNWTKSSYVANQDSESHVFPISIASERIQIKCCMQFTGDGEVHELALINTPHTKFE